MKALSKLLAAACGVVILVGSATAQTKNVLALNGNLAKETGVRPSGSLITASGSYSFALWLKIDDARCASRTDDVIVRVRTKSETSFTYDKTNKKFRMLRRSAFSGSPDDNQKFECDAPTDGEWHFVVGIFDKANAKFQIYVDETCYEEGGKSTANIDSLSTFQIGGYDDNSNHRCLCGWMAEMSVWQKALTSEEVKSLRKARPEDFTGCVAYWPMDEGNHGTDIRDISGAGHPLTIPAQKMSKSDLYIFDLTTVEDFTDVFSAGDDRVFLDVDVLYPKDEVSVVVSDATEKNGQYLKDSPATFTASAIKEGLVFDRWWGDVPEDQIYSESITLTIDDAKRIAPLYRDTTWVYDNKVLSDGYWKLNASISGDEVTVSSVKDYIPMDILDFSKPMVDAEGNPCKVVSFSGQVFFGYTCLKDVKLPNALRYIGCYENQYNINGCFDGCNAITNMAPFLPPTITYLAPEAFAGCWSLTGDLVLGGGAADLDCRPSPSWGRGSQFNNTRIDSLTLLKGFRTVAPSMFSACSALKRVEIAKGSVTNILASAFNNCKQVAEFVMPERPEIVDATAFNGWTSNQCRFVVHAAEPGWAAYMADAANFISWDALDANTRAGYKTKFVGEKRPLGLSLANPKNQWLCSDAEGGMKVLFR